MERACVKCRRTGLKLTRDMCPACYQAERRAGRLEPLPEVEPRLNRITVLFSNSELEALEGEAARDDQAVAAWVRDQALKEQKRRERRRGR